METELTCISCPIGCTIIVTTEQDKIVNIRGNSCIRGEHYATKEMTAPTRILTTTVRVTGGKSPLVSVKTKEDIPKGKMMEVMDLLCKVTLAAPVKIGDIILANVAETGIDVVATRNIMKI